MVLVKKIWKGAAFILINHFLSGTHFFALKRALLNSCYGITVGNGTKIVGPIKVFGTLNIGKYCWIGRNFAVEGNGLVDIGDNCDIAPSVSLFTGSHKIGTIDRRAGKGFCGTIKIGNGCWICGGVKAIPNVTIGSGVVVACGGVVVTDIQPNILVGGVPAKKIRELSEV